MYTIIAGMKPGTFESTVIYWLQLIAMVSNSHSSHSQIIASGCSKNTVINTALGKMLWLVSDLSTKYIELYGIAGLHKDNILFHQDILHSSISAMCYIYHCSYGTS